MNRLILLLIMWFTISNLAAQPALDTAAIIKKLEVIYERDQKTRASGDSAEFMAFIDSTNLIQVMEIVDTHGWLGKSVIGSRGNFTLFLVIQHADLVVQEKYFPLMEKSVAAGESRAIDLAFLQDRILMRQGKPQIYGSQIILNNSGGQEIYRIADEKNVNIRRQKVGLEPIEDYARRFGIEYQNLNSE